MDDKTKSSISEWLITALPSFVVIKFPPQAIEIRGEKLSHTLLDDDLVNHAHDDMATAAEVLQRASEAAVGKRRRSCVPEGGDEGGYNDDELRSEEEKEGEENEDEARLLGGQGEAALKMTCEPWSGRGRG